MILYHFLKEKNNIRQELERKKNKDIILYIEVYIIKTMLKKINKKFLKILILILILIYKEDSFSLMESIDEKKTPESLSWYNFCYKYKITILVIIGSVSIFIASFLISDLTKILWDIESITNINLFKKIQNIVNLYLNRDLDLEIKTNCIKILENLLKNSCEEHHKIKDPEKFNELIKELIKELKKPK